MFRKILRGSIFAAVAIILIIAVGWLKSIFLPQDAEIPKTAEIIPNGITAPGEVIRFNTVVTIPLQCTVTDAEIVGENIAVSNIGIRRKTWMFDRYSWSISGRFRTTAECRITDAALQVHTSGINRSQTYSIALPEIDSVMPEELTAGEKLLLAPEASDAEENYPAKLTAWIAAAVIAVIAAAVIIIFLKRRRKNHKTISLQEHALNAVRAVCRKAEAGECSAEKGFAEICDIIRSYLEKRFHIPATRKTTAEFMLDMQHPDSALSDSSRIFLTGFLNSADLIKFAGTKTDIAALKHAASGAEELIISTSLTQEDGK